MAVAALATLLIASASPAGMDAPASQASAAPAPLPDDTAMPETDRGGDTIIVTGHRHHAPGDPLEQVNVKSYEMVQSVDKAVVRPVSLAYKHALPGTVRSGLRNALHNLHQPSVFLNFLLQLKPGKAAETAGRFALNSTIGVVGLIDVAKRHPFNLPDRPNGFADTFGYYGVKPGAYLYLPLIGSTTVRDLFGDGLDRLLLPVAVGAPFNQLSFAVPTNILKSLDYRVEFDDQITRQRETERPYETLRSYYLQKRQEEIDALHGRTRPDSDTGTVPRTDASNAGNSVAVTSP